MNVQGAIAAISMCVGTFPFSQPTTVIADPLRTTKTTAPLFGFRTRDVTLAGIIPLSLCTHPKESLTAHHILCHSEIIERYTSDHM